MKKTVEVINGMQAAGIIGRYAIGGAMAAVYYTEPALTKDLGILLSFAATAEPGAMSGGLLTLGPISGYLANLGYKDWRKEGLVVEGWPVQFLPVADALDGEALHGALEASLDVGDGAVLTRVLRAEHLAAIALRTGRFKDSLRIGQLLEAGSFKKEDLDAVLRRHRLTDKWRRFCALSGLDVGTESVQGSMIPMPELNSPEIQDIVVRKAAARLERAKLTYGEKVLRVE